ncbi:daam-1 [Pristionchus pacificus]|uniref:Daam-1 n=1 Tax=Pristionchus pacificus TaxID=54126 RepID=A0A2A6C696_PRIPA|nr:daam-1 [Pristionchus pacificus]|eukprot:PDM73636.1 daam-1 [Pristionchus pacificus]
MSVLNDWVDRVLACFYREDDKGGGKGPPEPPDLLDPATLSDADLEEQFHSMLAQLELSDEKARELAGQSTEKKRAMLRSHATQLSPSSVSTLTAILSALLTRVETRSLPPLLEDSPLVTQLQDVVTALRTSEQSFLEEFIAAAGLSLLTSLLSLSTVQTPSSARIAFFILASIRALLNSNHGRKEVLSSANCLLSIASSIQIVDIRVKIAAIEILSGLCFATAADDDEGGPTRVLEALTEATKPLGERTRFQRLVDDLHREFHSERETDRLRTSIMSLLNALLRTGQAEESTEFRLHLRYELLALGINEVLENCRGEASPRLADHIELFEMMRKEDEMSLSKKRDDSGASSPVDFESPGGMAEALAARLSNSVALNHFISLLQHLFMVPSDETHIPLWRLFDLVLQHICLQSTLTGISDVQKGLPTIDMADVMCRLRSHGEYERVEKELELTRHQLKEEKRRREEVEGAGTIASLPSVSPPASPSSMSSSGFSSGASNADTASISSTLPPVCPPALAPPPPPPPPPPLGGLGHQPIKKKNDKNVPKPRTALKTLNWRKIPADRVKGTAWESMEDEKMYKTLDLVSLETQFAAPSGQKDDDTVSIAGTISRGRREKIAVVDSRKAQNCTIMLNRLRMSNRDIRRSLLAMDDRIPKDMIEQMLKFVPSEREKRQLKEVVSRFGNASSCLTTADAFLYEISEIPRYEQRLKCLHIIRSFKERLDLLEPSIQVVSRCCVSVSSSRRLCQFLSLVLAVGNYLNYGKRSGDASAFEISSLLSLSDLKSTLRADRSLLHHLCQILDSSFPEVAKLRLELGPLQEAARFNKTEVLAELRSLERAVSTVRAAMEEIASTPSAADTPPVEGDQFTAVARAFVESAHEEFTTLERAFFKMQAEMWQEHEQEVQVKRQTIARSFFARKNRKRDKERDFDQLISALQSGEIFSDELSRLRTSFRVPGRAPASSTVGVR